MAAPLCRGEIDFKHSGTVATTTTVAASLGPAGFSSGAGIVSFDRARSLRSFGSNTATERRGYSECETRSSKERPEHCSQ